uniref:C2 NT-type domain-containing protein n=1 Tax=Oryza glumipatula TaxID=40148 RepID=A0A0E0BVE0_9ORYZ
MVARMWPWPPPARKFRVRLVVRRAEGLTATATASSSPVAEAKVAVEVRWKGPKASPLGSLRRVMHSNRTRLESAAEAAVAWEEEFERVETFTATSHRKSGAAFHPWDLAFSVFVNDSNKGPKGELILGTASLNLAEYTSASEEVEIILPLSVPNGSSESSPSLHLTLSLVELGPPHQSPDASQRSAVTAPLSPSSGDSVPSSKDEVSSVIKAGLRNLKILTDLVSTRRSKKTNRDDDGSEDKCYVHSDGAEYPSDTDSLDEDLDDRERDDGLGGSTVRKSFSYGSLQSVNYAGGLLYAHARIDGEHEDWIYYSHRKSEAGYSVEQEASSTAEEPVVSVSRRSLLPWKKKRKLNLRLLKVLKNKGEPLLKKGNDEEGGDDIDYDRRLLTTSDGNALEGSDSSINSMVSIFGDDNFVVGNWESKEVLSRDGHLRLSTQVFFASIDQRSERAAGESACTALVAVIADWFEANQDLMPICSQFDSLIREGSLEWRKLCENETYRERFPDKHFDLETVLHAKIRPLTVSPNRSFIGFFQPESTEDGSGFDFLDGAMSFDNIWDEISRAAECSTEKPTLYIVSWNDHFFVLKVEAGAYYIIDTLGERLYEGCSQAYILKFDDNTTIHKVPAEKKEANPDSSGRLKDSSDSSSTDQDSGTDTEECELVSKGKESCKEYIKSFLAAIPIRELQADIKKGIIASTPLHHRLQIEFHYTESCPEEIPLPAPLPAIEAPFEFSWPEPPPAMEVTLAPAVAAI